LFKEAQVEFLEFGGRPSGGDLGDDVYKALERVRRKDLADVDKKIKELKDEIKVLQAEIKDLEGTKIKELEAKIDALQTGVERRWSWGRRRTCLGARCEVSV